MVTWDQPTGNFHQQLESFRERNLDRLGTSRKPPGVWGSVSTLMNYQTPPWYILKFSENKRSQFCCLTHPGCGLSPLQLRRVRETKPGLQWPHCHGSGSICDSGWQPWDGLKTHRGSQTSRCTSLLDAGEELTDRAADLPPATPIQNRPLTSILCTLYPRYALF